MILSEVKERADGKWSCTITFSGGRNAFGGREFGKSYRKIVDREKLEHYKRLHAQTAEQEQAREG